MGEERRREKVRSAAAQAAALAGARREMRRWGYGQQERRLELRAQDVRLGGG